MRAARKAAIDKLQHVAGAPLTVDCRLNEHGVGTIRGRPRAVADFGLDVAAAEMLGNSALERGDGRRVARNGAAWLANEGVPHPAITFVIGVTDLFGMPEAVGMVDEQPDRPRVAVRLVVKQVVLGGDRVECRLPCFVRHGRDTLGVVDHAGQRGIVHLVDGAQQRAYDVRFWCVPVHRDRQRDPAMLKIVPQRRCWRITEKAGQCRHVAPSTFDGPAVATLNVAVTDPAAFVANLELGFSSAGDLSPAVGSISHTIKRPASRRVRRHAGEESGVADGMALVFP